MSLQTSTLQGSSSPRVPRRGKQTNYATPVSEVGMWKAKSNSTQTVLDEKLQALEHFKTEQTKSAVIAFQHVFDRSSSVSTLLNQLRSSIEGCLTALGPDRTHRMMETILQASNDINSLRDCCQKLSTANDREVALLGDALKTSAELRNCLKNRAEVGEQEYKKLVHSCERQEAIVSRARTYIKVCMTERLAWQQEHGANPAKLPELGDTFVDRCRRALEHLSAGGSILPSVAVLETPADATRRFEQRAEENLNGGAALRRYVNPQEELALLEEALKTSGTDVAAHRELVDRERRFELARDDVARQSSVALECISTVRSALGEIRDQLARISRDGFINQLSARIVNAVSTASVLSLPHEVATDESLSAEKALRRRDTGGVSTQRKSVHNTSMSPKSRATRLLSNSVGAAVALVSPKRGQSSAVRNQPSAPTVGDVDPAPRLDVASSRDSQLLNLADKLENSLGNTRSLPFSGSSLSWKSPNATSIDDIASASKSVSLQISPTSSSRDASVAAIQIHSARERPVVRKAPWQALQPAESESDWPIPTTIQLIFDEVENPTVRPSIDNHRISIMLKRNSQTASKVEEAIKRVSLLDSATILPHPPVSMEAQTTGAEFSQKTLPLRNNRATTSQSFQRSISRK